MACRSLTEWQSGAHEQLVSYSNLNRQIVPKLELSHFLRFLEANLAQHVHLPETRLE